MLSSTATITLRLIDKTLSGYLDTAVCKVGLYGESKGTIISIILL